MFILSIGSAILGTVLCVHFFKVKFAPPPHHYSIWYDLIYGVGFYALAYWAWGEAA